jgi:hypothetical protein
MFGLMAETKICRKCGGEKPLEDFTPQASGAMGRIGRCRPCRAADEQARVRRDPAKRRATERARRALDLERRRKRARDLRKANIEHYRALGRDAYYRAREKRLEYAKGRYRGKAEELKTYQRDYHRRRYGLSKQDYARMVEAQSGRCVICGLLPKPRPNSAGVLVVDHDHATGNVRGLLCGKCNTALGMMDDDPTRLEAAACYLRARADAAAA